MKKINKVVIPIAGYGSRMFPATLGIVKAMLPLVDKPVILYLLEEAIKADIKEVIIVMSKSQESVKDYLTLKDEKTIEKFKDKKEVKELKDLLAKVKLSFVIQTSQKGLGDAIACCEEACQGEDFGVILGDNPILCKEDIPFGIGQLKEEYEKNPGYYIGVKEVELSETKRYGIVSGKDYHKTTFLLDGMVEKPQDNPPSNCAALGRYILGSSVFKYLKEITYGVGGEIQITDAIRIAIEKEKVYGTKLVGTCHDTGNRTGFVMANIDYSSVRNDVWDEVKEFIKNNL